MNEEEAREYIDSTLNVEKIVPFRADELEVVKSIGQCINCGLCIQHCPVVVAVGLDRFSGPRSIAVELSRSPPEFWSTGDKVFLCTGCGTCREICPKSVDIPEIVNMIRARIFKHRPDLVPKALHSVDKTILEHGLAFEPWEDEEEKAESRDMRLERLGIPYYPDRVKDKADVLFYPGCQAEERTQEVREAAKGILEVFDIDYTVLKEMSCCGLPAILLGNNDAARDLATKLKRKIKASGVKKVVTTCAGCTSNLSFLSERDDWDLPVYHMLEFLAEEIGLDTLCKKLEDTKESVEVTIHSPCHLIRHTSRQIMNHTVRILETMKDVSYIPSRSTDSCCGGGGLVGYHSPDVATSVVKENLRAIKKTGASRVVTPCPLCTAQLENNFFKDRVAVDVDDMTVFIAQHLPVKKG